MSSKSIGLSDELHAYLVAHNGATDPIVTDLVEQTWALLPGQAVMQIATEQATFLTFLTRLVNARNAVEVGTFTGLSALSIARGLVPGGRLVCCDVSEEYTAVARAVWDRAGVADLIDLRIAPATQTLATLPDEPYLDFSFIDADKTGYPAYWAEIVPRTRAGGLIVVDNVLRDGQVIAPEPDPDTQAIIDFNAQVLLDKRVESVMIPVADGLTLARKL